MGTPSYTHIYRDDILVTMETLLCQKVPSKVLHHIPNNCLNSHKSAQGEEATGGYWTARHLIAMVIEKQGMKTKEEAKNRCSRLGENDRDEEK